MSYFRLPNSPVLTRESFYNEVRKIPWLDYLDETKTFAIDANITHPQIRHSLYGAQLVKDAICDVIREKKGVRPSVDVKNPDVQLNIFIQNKRATLSFDTSGMPLYKRGWKESSGEASLPETLAAAILMRAGYSEREILCDPFCGAGTFLIEAACMATQTPAGYFRKKWGFVICLPLKLPNGKSSKIIGIRRDVPWNRKRSSALMAMRKQFASVGNICIRQALKKMSFFSTARLPSSPFPAHPLWSSPILHLEKGCTPQLKSIRTLDSFCTLVSCHPVGVSAHFILPPRQSHWVYRPFRMAPSAWRS